MKQHIEIKIGEIKMTKLFMMVGIAGSGKSTLAKKIAEQQIDVI